MFTFILKALEKKKNERDIERGKDRDRQREKYKYKGIDNKLCWKVLSSIDRSNAPFNWTCNDRILVHTLDMPTVCLQTKRNETMTFDKIYCHAHRTFAETVMPNRYLLSGYICPGYCWNPFRFLIDCEVILLDKRRTVLWKRVHCSRTIVFSKLRNAHSPTSFCSV